MASPLLDESLLTYMLEAPPAAEAGDQLRSAGLLVVLDAYDHKVDREAFIKTLKAAIQLNEMMGRLESITGIQYSMKNDKLTIESVDAALAKITAMAETFRHSLADDLKLFVQCPGDEDTKH